MNIMPANAAAEITTKAIATNRNAIFEEMDWIFTDWQTTIEAMAEEKYCFAELCLDNAINFFNNHAEDGIIYDARWTLESFMTSIAKLYENAGYYCTIEEDILIINWGALINI